MPAATLDDFMALNDQLVALVQAGVPLDLGLEGSQSNTAVALERVNTVVARRVSQGATLSEALQGHDPALPARYRHLAQLGLSSGDLSAALQNNSQLAQSVEGSWYT